MKHIILILTLCLLAACGAKTTSEEHVANATKFLEKSEYSSAIIELKNALLKDGSNQQARFLLGRAYVETGDMAGADKELGMALELGAPKAEVVPLYAQTLLALGKHDNLAELTTEGLDTEGSSTLMAAQALSMLSQNYQEGAVQLMDEALNSPSVSPYALVAGARFSLLRDPTGQEARALLDKALTIDAGYAPAWSLIGDVEISGGQLALAEEAYTKAIESSSNNFTDRYKRGLVRVSAQQLEAVESDINAMQKMIAQHPGLEFLKGMLYLSKREFEPAKTSFDNASLAGDNYPLALYYLAAIHREEGNLETALSHINRFMAIAPNNDQGRKLAATIEYQRENYPRVQALLQPVVANDPTDVHSLNLLANALIATGETEQGMALLQRVAMLEPGSAEALTRLGSGFIALGEQELGIENLRAALQLEPQLQQADVALVVGYIQQGNIEAALAQAKEYRDKHPDDVAPYNLLGQVHMAAGDTEEAKKAFLKALDVAPGDPTASQFLANMALQARDPAAGREFYDKVLEVNPNHLGTLLNLAALNALEGKEKPMVELLQRAITAHPVAIQPRIVLARYYLLKGQNEEVDKLLGEIPNQQKQLPAVMAVSLEADLNQQRYRAAQSSLQKLVKAQPGSARNHFLLARSYTGLNEIPKAIEELKRSIELSPNFLMARVALSRLYLLTQSQDLFEQQVEALQSLAPGHPDVLQLEAALENSKGNRAGAEAKLEAAFQQDANTRSLIALAVQRRAAGNVAGALDLLGDWVGKNKDDLQAKMAFAEFLMADGKNKEAIAQYNEIVRLDEKNIPALNNLAWLLREQEPSSALKHIQKAISLASGSPSASLLDTQAVVLLNNGQLESARRSIDGALKAAPDNTTIRFHSAQISVAENNKELAAKELAALLDNGQPFPEKEAARQLLDKLQKGN